MAVNRAKHLYRRRLYPRILGYQRAQSCIQNAGHENPNRDRFSLSSVARHSLVASSSNSASNRLSTVNGAVPEQLTVGSFFSAQPANSREL